MNTKRNYSDLFAICKKFGFDYKEKVLEYTNDKTDSLRSLTDIEYNDLLERLQALTATKDFDKKPGDKQRKKLIRLALTMHWGNGDKKQAIRDLNGWCRKQKFKKGLNQHSEPELDLLVTIFELKVYGDYLRDLNK